MIVLDTHILIWDALAPERLSETARRAIARGNLQEGMLVADISLWEIAMLVEKKRIQVELDVQGFLNLILQANQLQVEPISAEIATLAVRLPAGIGQDPADRLIAATALARNAPLVTADKNLQDSHILPTLW